MYFHYMCILLSSPLGKGFGPSFKQIWIPLTEGCFVHSWIEIGLVVLEKILNFVNVFSLFCYCLALGKDVALHLKKHQSPLLKDDFFQV